MAYGSDWKTSNTCSRTDCSGRRCSTACSTPRSRRSESSGLAFSRCCSTIIAVQEHLARNHPAAVDRADRALRAGVLVDLRSAVLDHLLSFGRRAACPQHQCRFPRHALAGALFADRRQHLARHPVRGDLAAGGAADNLAVALRSRCWTAPPPGNASATSPSDADADPRDRDDVLDHLPSRTSSWSTPSRAADRSTRRTCWRRSRSSAAFPAACWGRALRSRSR